MLYKPLKQQKKPAAVYRKTFAVNTKNHENKNRIKKFFKYSKLK